MSPWEIYLVLLAVPVVVCVGWIAVAYLPKRAPVDPERPLTVYELAYLAGGDTRVVETAIAGLVERGVLRPSSDGKVLATGVTPTDPLEAAVAAAATGRSTWSIAKRVRLSAHVQALAVELERRGLVAPRSKARAIFRTVLRMYVALLAAGITMLVTMLVLGRPIGTTPLLLALNVVACLVSVKATKRYMPAQTTSTGRVALTHARRQQSVLLLAGAAGAVAVGGLGAYPDQTVGHALEFPPTGGGGFFGTGGDGGGHDGGGSSCSGGSSCGGGGGGCGGGGCGGGGS